MKLKTSKQLVEEAMDKIKTISPSELKEMEKKKNRSNFNRYKRYKRAKKNW